MTPPGVRAALRSVTGFLDPEAAGEDRALAASPYLPWAGLALGTVWAAPLLAIAALALILPAAAARLATNAVARVGFGLMAGPLAVTLTQALSIHAHSDATRGRSDVSTRGLSAQFSALIVKSAALATIHAVLAGPLARELLEGGRWPWWGSCWVLACMLPAAYGRAAVTVAVVGGRGGRTAPAPPAASPLKVPPVGAALSLGVFLALPASLWPPATAAAAAFAFVAWATAGASMPRPKGHVGRDTIHAALAESAETASVCALAAIAVLAGP